MSRGTKIPSDKLRQARLPVLICMIPSQLCFCWDLASLGPFLFLRGPRLDLAAVVLLRQYGDQTLNLQTQTTELDCWNALDHRSIPGHREDRKITKEIRTHVFPSSLAHSPPDQVLFLDMGPILHKRRNIYFL